MLWVILWCPEEASSLGPEVLYMLAYAAGQATDQRDLG